MGVILIFLPLILSHCTVVYHNHSKDDTWKFPLQTSDSEQPTDMATGSTLRCIFCSQYELRKCFQAPTPRLNTLSESLI